MSQLIQLRQKIKAIQTTKKITHAVRLVSMSLYAKLERKNAYLKKHSSAVKEMFVHLLSNAESWQSPLFFPNDILDSSPLFILVASTKGLCGSLNSNLFRYFDRTVFIEEQQSPTFITVGRKATRFIQENGVGSILCSYQELTSTNFISITNDLIAKIAESKHSFSSVSFYSNKLKSFFVQQPHKTTLIPFELDSVSSQDQGDQESGFQQKDQNQSSDDVIWEQNHEEILDYVSVSFLRSSIMKLLFEALLAEQAARFIAMDSSTNNAQKYLDALILSYNKQRQSLITREVSELSATASDS